MKNYRRTTSCWLTSQALCFCLLLQGSGIAQALPLAPKQTFVSETEIKTTPLQSAAPVDGSTEGGFFERFADQTRTAAEEAGDSLGRWLEDRWTPTNGGDKASPRVAQAAGTLPLPARLMSVLMASSGRGQAAPPSPPDLRNFQVPATLPAELAQLLEKATLEEIPLLAGLNLISIPGEPADSDPAVIFADIAGELGKVTAHNACDLADPWKVYDPANPTASDLTAVDHKIGMWVSTTAAALLPSDGTMPATTTMELCEGWNLIGFPTGEPRHPHAALASIAGKWQRIFGYDAFDSNDPWEVFSVDVPDWANDLQVMQPGRGYWVLVTEATTLEIRNQGPPPTVAIASPADLSVVTQPTEIIGTVESDRLDSWTLTYRAIGDGEAVTLATSTAPVASGTLATFDPTLLLNGLYELELTATDVQGQQVSESIAVSVEGQMKIGHFTLSFVDLRVPVSGLDIEVIRTYDSRDKQPRDFGVGWSLDIRQGSYRNNRAPGDGWQLQAGLVACDTAVESKSHLTVVRLSDREVYRFALRLVRGVPRAGGGCSATAEFAYVDGPLPGTTLAIIGNDQVFQETQSSNRVLDLDTFSTYEPQQVRLTTRDGRIFELDLNDDVTLVEDLNGNQLTITPAGINHSSGKSIVFERDVEGRITRITDPLDRANSYAYDTSGDLVIVTDRAGVATRFAYDGDHRLLDIEDTRGVKPIRYEYDTDGRVVRHIDALGKVIELEHDLANSREIVTNRLGASRSLEYDSRGNVVREVDELGKVTTRVFDGRDNLLSQTDPLGRTTTLAYSTNSDLTTRTDPLGNQIHLNYNNRGEVLTMTDSRGGVTAYVYDTRGNLITTTDASNAVTSFTYDANGNGLTMTDALGNVIALEYDAFGNTIRETGANGYQVVSTFDAIGNRLSETRTRSLPDGSSLELITSFAWDDLDRLTTTTEADGSVSSRRYDLHGNVTQQIDPLGRVTSMSYDLMGRLTEVSFPDGTVESQSFDAENRTVASTDRGGRTTTFAYDAAGRLLSTTFPDGSVTSSVYDAAGQETATTDTHGNTTSLSYDAAGRMTAVIDPLGNSQIFTYDTNGNHLSTTNASGKIWSQTYSALNQLTKITHPDGTEIRFTYDKLRRRVSKIDQAGVTTLSNYDALGRLIQVTDGLGQLTTYTYDEVGNRMTQSDANGQTTRFEYDQLGRRTLRVLPDGAAEITTYRADGTVATHTDFKGDIRTLEYDSAKRLIRRNLSDGSEFTFTYTPTGQRSTVTDARGVTTYVYDSRDRLIEKVDPNGNKLSYTWDSQGNRTSLTATVGAQALTTNYAYDSRDRLITATDSQGGVTRLGYDADGRRESLEHANGVTTNTTYDDLDRVTELRSETSIGEVLQRFQYTLGPAGTRTRIDELDGTSHYYQFDALYRLTRDRVTDTAGALVYQRDFTYDSVGNRLSQTLDDGGLPETIASSYDSRDRLLTAGPTSYGWDAEGNLTDDGTTTYQWDVLNRLTSVTLDDGTVVETTYDADGNRVRTVTSPSDGGLGLTVDYLVDTSGILSHVVAEIAEGQIQTLYTRADDQLISLYRVTSGASRYYHSDALGSVRLMSDETGTVTDRYTYTAFGELLEHVGTDPQPYQFTGEPYEPHSELYFNRARWLDAATGRFVAADPFAGFLSDPLSLHRYQYAGLNPVSATDPSGLFSVSEMNIVGSIRSNITQIQITVALAIVTQPSIDPRGEISKSLLIATLVVGGPGLIKGLFRLGRTAKRMFRGAADWVRNGGIRRTFKSISSLLRHGRSGLPPGYRTLALMNTKGTGVSAIGPFRVPEGVDNYITFANKNNASYFDIGMDAWNRLNKADPGVGKRLNMYWLDSQIAVGDKFIMSIPRYKVRPGTDLADEIQRLLKNGYTWANDSTLIKIMK